MQRTLPIRTLSAVALSYTITLAAGAAEMSAAGQRTTPGAQPPVETSRPDRRDVAVYRPNPRWGSVNEKARVGGGTRSAGSGAHVKVLAPEEVGVTSHAQPTLYWYLAEPASGPVQLVVIDPDAIDPLVEKTLAPPVAAGVHSFSLADAGAELALNKSYDWGVSIVRDPSRRSLDVFAGGAIRRVPADSKVQQAERIADPTERVRALASIGLWYDAIDVNAQALERDPSAPVRAQRRALLDQVGLEAVAP